MTHALSSNEDLNIIGLLLTVWHAPKVQQKKDKIGTVVPLRAEMANVLDCFRQKRCRVLKLQKMNARILAT